MNSLSNLSWGDAAALLLLSTWLLATIIFQFNPNHRWLQNSLVVAVFPVWHLFAPAPILGDYHLLYRTTEPDGDTEPDWLEVPIVGDHTMLHSLFHPGRYTEKSITSVVSQLSADMAASDDASASWAYWRLDYLVQHHAAALDAAPLQWAVVESYGYRQGKESELVFMSPVAERVTHA